jgi:hypothetical protein
MASKALTKEVRSIISTKTSAARKRMHEANATDKIVSVVGAPLGTAVGAALDAYDVGIPFGEGRKIPLTPFGAALGIGIGLFIKGPVGAGITGFGVGQLDAFVYKGVRDLLDDKG